MHNTAHSLHATAPQEVGSQTLSMEEVGNKSYEGTVSGQWVVLTTGH